MPLRERVPCGNLLPWIPGPESRLPLPEFLPLGFNQIKRILPAHHRHKPDILNPAADVGKSNFAGAVSDLPSAVASARWNGQPALSCGLPARKPVAPTNSYRPGT